MARKIDFFFDFVSPFSYLAHARLPSIAAKYGYSIEYHPIDLQTAKLAIGNTGPATREMPIKLEYMRLDLRRWAAVYGVPFKPVVGYGSRRVNCITFFAIDRNCVGKYVNFTWDLIWGQGGAMNDDGLLKKIAQAMEWETEEMFAFAGAESTAKRLDAENQRATSLGVFGAPTMLIGDQMWWGNDRLSFLEDYLRESAQ